MQVSGGNQTQCRMAVGGDEAGAGSWGAEPRAVHVVGRGAGMSECWQGGSGSAAVQDGLRDRDWEVFTLKPALA